MVDSDFDRSEEEDEPISDEEEKQRKKRRITFKVLLSFIPITIFFLAALIISALSSLY